MKEYLWKPSGGAVLNQLTPPEINSLLRLLILKREIKGDSKRRKEYDVVPESHFGFHVEILENVLVFS